MGRRCARQAAGQWLDMDCRIDFSSVDALLREAVAEGVIPGAGVCIRTADSVLHTASFGQQELKPVLTPATNQTVWDVASLTKVLATTPIAMGMVADGSLDLHTPVSRLFPDAPEGVTAAHLLSHSSGLGPWLPMAELVGIEGAGTDAAREAVLSLARTSQVHAEPGEAYAYSDLGFLTLCSLLEELGQTRLDGLYERYVRSPSGVDLRFGWPGAAATEDCPQRQRVIKGEVHDLNAWIMGGVSSHAGLFGSVESVAAAAAWQFRAWLGASSEGLSPAVAQVFFETKGAGSHRLGWDGVSEGGSAGPLWPRDGVGHLAFTGCSIWMAPKLDLVVALCTNRLHPEIEGGAVPDAPIHPRYAAFRKLRPALYTAVIEAMGERTGWPD